MDEALTGLLIGKVQGEPVVASVSYKHAEIAFAHFAHPQSLEEFKKLAHEELDKVLAKYVG